MTRWQPPIPPGMLYSPAARKLGAGIALLLWCYDAVDRTTGIATIRLADAAMDLEGESYHTIKRWWHAMKNGPFFMSIQDRGRAGFAVTFHPDWIDWRQLPECAAQGSKMILEECVVDAAEGSKMILDTPEVPLKDISSAVEGSKMILDGDTYMVLHDDQESIAVGASDDAPRPPLLRSRKPVRAPEPPTPANIRAVLADLCSIDLEGRTATRAQTVSLNAEAKRLWQAAQSQGKNATECEHAIRYVAGWVRQTVYPFSNGQPLTPAAIRERWRAAMDARSRQTAAYPPARAAPDHDPPPALTADQFRAGLMAAGYQGPV